MTSAEPIHPETRRIAIELHQSRSVPDDMAIPSELYNYQPWPRWAIEVLCWTEERLPEFLSRIKRSQVPG